MGRINSIGMRTPPNLCQFEIPTTRAGAELVELYLFENRNSTALGRIEIRLWDEIPATKFMSEIESQTNRTRGWVELFF